MRPEELTEEEQRKLAEQQSGGAAVGAGKFGNDPSLDVGDNFIAPNGTPWQVGLSEPAGRGGGGMTPARPAGAPVNDDPTKRSTVAAANGTVAAAQQTSEATSQQAPGEEAEKKKKRRWTDFIWKSKQPGETDDEKRQRQEENQRRLGGYLDLINSFIGLGYATKGGRSMYAPENGFYQTTDKHQKDMEERRRKNEDAYFSRYLKQREADRKEYKDRADEEIKRAQLAIKEAQADQKAELNDLNMQLIQGKIDEQSAKTQEAQIRAKYADRIQQENVAILMARQGYWNAATGAQNSLANERDTRAANVGKGKSGSSSGGSSSGGGGSSSGGSGKSTKKKQMPWNGSSGTGSADDLGWGGFQG